MSMRDFDRRQSAHLEDEDDIGAPLFDPDELRDLYADGPPAYLQNPRRRRMKKGWRGPE